MAFASQTLAGPFREPYQPKLARMSTSNILGLHRRDVEGYSPMEQLCGAGDTCAEACGKGFSQCASKDDLTHCYNRSKKQTCCPGGTGDSCDNGYFCSADTGGQTWCCPDGLSLQECAQKYDIPGPLTSQAPHTSTTSATTTTTTITKITKTKSVTSTSSTSTRKTTTTSTKSKKPEGTESTTTPKTVHHESTSKSKPKETITATPSSSTTTILIDVSNALISTEAAATQTNGLELAPSSTPSTSPASTSTNSIGSSGSSSHGPINGLVLFIAGALVALA
ncbi:hypothetical protein CIB48_g11106 [Xylaria polymorpha]|nr:hypothetical protein CIB48_g11106 [Xylaria polymorpha]